MTQHLTTTGGNPAREISLGRAGAASGEGLDRRLFLRLAAYLGGSLALGGAGIMGGARTALAEPSASEATLGALSDAQAAYEDAVNQLNALGQQAEEAQYALSQTQAQLDETNAAIADLQASIEQKQSELAAAQDTLADRISSNYKVGKSDALSMLLDATSFDDLITRIYYAGKVSDADAQAIDTVKTLKSELEQEQADLQTKKAEQEQLVAQQQADSEALQQQVDNMQGYVNGLSAEVQQLLAQKAAEEAAAAEAQRQQHEAELAAQAAAQAQQQGGSDATNGGGATDGGSTGGSDAGSGGNAGDGSDAGGDYSGGSSGGSSSGGGTGNHAGGAAGIAWSYIGVPYVWGGTDPSGFDCSGLAQYCYALAGYSIARDTYGQIAQIQSLGNWKTSMDELQPGDLVFPHSGHVGIYEGGGMMIHAPAPGRSVEYASVYAFMGGGSPI